MQLVAYGAQDVYLTGNPQITFFKVVYRRHTNFAMESIEQSFTGQQGSNMSCTISRNGDLIHKMYLRVEVPAADTAGTGKLTWANKLGLALVKSVELEIGGQRIDKHYGDWMNIWNELSLPESKKSGYYELVGATGSDNKVISNSVGQELDGTKGFYVGGADNNKVPSFVLNIPLEFWFCRNPGLALPLIALQYHEVKVKIECNSGSKLVTLSGTGVTIGDVAQTTSNPSVTLSKSSLWVDYIYLDTDERRRFAQTSHEYLIEQLQFTGEDSVKVSESKTTTTTQRLNFNHPVKELVWVCQPSEHSSSAVNQFDYQAYLYAGNAVNKDTDAKEVAVNPVVEATIKLNGHDRMAQRTGDYFNAVQPFQHHTRVPSDKGINVYSFALKPEEHQPSGTCNMSRIDVAQLQMTIAKIGSSSSNVNVRVYATNYNVLRIMSGMGGLAYAN